jgi:hypothetical protein
MRTVVCNDCQHLGKSSVLAVSPPGEQIQTLARMWKLRRRATTILRQIEQHRARERPISQRHAPLRCASSLEAVPQFINDRRRHAIPETTRCTLVSFRDGRCCSKHCQWILHIAHNRRGDSVREDERGVRRAFGEHHTILTPRHCGLWFSVRPIASYPTGAHSARPAESTDARTITRTFTGPMDVCRAYVRHLPLPDRSRRPRDWLQPADRERAATRQNASSDNRQNCQRF